MRGAMMSASTWKWEHSDQLIRTYSQSMSYSAVRVMIIILNSNDAVMFKEHSRQLGY